MGQRCKETASFCLYIVSYSRTVTRILVPRLKAMQREEVDLREEYFLKGIYKDSCAINFYPFDYIKKKSQRDLSLAFHTFLFLSFHPQSETPEILTAFHYMSRSFVEVLNVI